MSHYVPPIRASSAKARPLQNSLAAALAQLSTEKSMNPTRDIDGSDELHAVLSPLPNTTTTSKQHNHCQADNEIERIPDPERGQLTLRRLAKASNIDIGRTESVMKALRRVTHLHLDSAKLNDTDLQYLKMPAALSSDSDAKASKVRIARRKEAIQAARCNRAPLEFCHKLQVLYLHDNVLASIPDLSFAKNLRYLYLQNNGLTSMANLATSCTGLQKL
jgi:Leucine-rich repeat (LRR) protein